jgi:hypothetical protein
MDDEERKALEAQLQAAPELFASVDPAFIRQVTDAAKAATEWLRILSETQASIALEREFLPQLAAEGWLISPSGPIDQPERLSALYEKEGIHGVDRYLIECLDSDACSVIVDVITQQGVFAPWRPTFAKALGVLERGDHELAIPIWLAALEFGCANELGVRDVYSKPEPASRNVVQTQLASVSTVHEPLALAWLEVLLGFSGQRGRAPAIFHRHAVMHGERPHIGTRKDALQCLLALEVLTYLVEARDRASRRPSPLRAGS